MTGFANAVVPAILGICAVLILGSKKPLFDVFLDGAREGMQVAIGLFPTLCGLLAAVSMLQASGLADTLGAVLEAVWPLPEGIAPFLILRPISGSASTAMLTGLMESFGPDSKTGILASVLMASGDTLIYVLTVYTAAAGIRRAPAAVTAGILAMLASTLTAILLLT